MKRLDIAIAVVVWNGRILICQGKPGGSLGGYWEFPGGKCEPGESIEDCLTRELCEEVDLIVTPTDRLTPIVHDYPDAHVTLHPFLCRRVSGEAKNLQSQRCMWIEPAQLREYQFPPANESLIQEIQERLS